MPISYLVFELYAKNNCRLFIILKLIDEYYTTNFYTTSYLSHCTHKTLNIYFLNRYWQKPKLLLEPSSRSLVMYNIHLCSEMVFISCVLGKLMICH